MFRCKDPIITALNGQGYNVIRLPKGDLKPSQLLSKSNGELKRLGDLTTVFITGKAAEPRINPGNPAPNITVTKSSDLKIGVGLSILSGLISALGGSTLGLSASYSRAKSVSLEITAMSEDNIQVAQLDQFLAAADINPFSRAVKEMLEDDDVFVITSLIKSKSLVVQAKDEAGGGLDLDVPVISNAIGGKLKVEASAADSSKISYEGAVPLAFGFQAVRLVFENGAYKTMEALDAGDAGLEAVGKEKTSHLLMEERLVGEF